MYEAPSGNVDNPFQQRFRQTLHARTLQSLAGNYAMAAKVTVVKIGGEQSSTPPPSFFQS